MPECPRCGEHHSDNWFRVYTPDGSDIPKKCPDGWFDFNDNFAEYQNATDIQPE